MRTKIKSWLLAAIALLVVLFTTFGVLCGMWGTASAAEGETPIESYFISPTSELKFEKGYNYKPNEGYNETGLKITGTTDASGELIIGFNHLFDLAEITSADWLMKVSDITKTLWTENAYSISFIVEDSAGSGSFHVVMRSLQGAWSQYVHAVAGHGKIVRKASGDTPILPPQELYLNDAGTLMLGLQNQKFNPGLSSDYSTIGSCVGTNSVYMIAYDDAEKQALASMGRVNGVDDSALVLDFDDPIVVDYYQKGAPEFTSGKVKVSVRVENAPNTEYSLFVEEAAGVSCAGDALAGVSYDEGIFPKMYPVGDFFTGYNDYTPQYHQQVIVNGDNTVYEKDGLKLTGTTDDAGYLTFSYNDPVDLQSDWLVKTSTITHDWNDLTVCYKAIFITVSDWNDPTDNFTAIFRACPDRANTPHAVVGFGKEFTFDSYWNVLYPGGSMVYGRQNAAHGDADGAYSPMGASVVHNGLLALAYDKDTKAVYSTQDNSGTAKLPIMEFENPDIVEAYGRSAPEFASGKVKIDITVLYTPNTEYSLFVESVGDTSMAASSLYDTVAPVIAYENAPLYTNETYTADTLYEKLNIAAEDTLSETEIKFTVYDAGGTPVSAAEFAPAAGMYVVVTATDESGNTASEKIVLNVSGKAYTITFIIDADTRFTVQTEHGKIPVPTYSGSSYDNESRTFTGWSPELVAATEDAAYTAQFDLKQYSVRFKQNAEDTQPYEKQFDYGTMPVYDGPALDTEGLTHTGWTPELALVTGEATYTATYETRKYTITWMVDGLPLSDEWEYGSLPEYGDTEGLSTDRQKFVGWTPEVVQVTGDATYTAVFETYIKVTFVNDDGTELKTEYVKSGTGATAPETPVKASDVQYNYIFAGWDKAFDSVTEDTTVKATYTQELRKYTVTWSVDGTEHKTEVAYGTVPVFDGDTSKNGYTFVGWDKEVVAVTGDVTYTAVYEKTPDKKGCGSAIDASTELGGAGALLLLTCVLVLRKKRSGGRR